MFTIIAAAAENNALGKDNEMVWNLPDDYKRFRDLTTGHTIILGRKTFESLVKPLPNRKHIIITRQNNYSAPEDCVVVSSLKKAMSLCVANQEHFVIGGGEIYKQAIDFVDKIELTRVHTEVEADAFFPEIDLKKWKLIKEEYHPKDEKHKFDFTYLTYVKNSDSEI